MHCVDLVVVLPCLALSCGHECSNHAGAKCADIHNLDPWSAADVVTVSRTKLPGRYIARQIISIDGTTTTSTTVATTSSSSSTTTTATDDLSSTVHALIANFLYPFSPRTVMPGYYTRRSVCRADDLRSLTRSPKRTRTTSTSAERFSRRPFTVFTSKRATRTTRSRTTRCKHYCHAFLHHGRKCLSPCVRRQPGHFHCRCARHQRR